MTQLILYKIKIQSTSRKMAQVTELEEAEHGKSSFLDYVCAFVGCMIWILTKPLVVFRELFNTEQVNRPGSHIEDEKLIVATRDRNWIDYYCHDNECLLNTGNASVKCFSDVVKLFGWQFKQVYSSSPQIPTPSTARHVTVINYLQSPNPATYTPDSNYEKIMATLTRLQDNGDFDAFEKSSSALLCYYGNKNPDITVAVLIEQSRCMLYRSRLAQAKCLARTSLELSTSTTCPGVYIARACLVLSACYRQKGKLGKAKIFLDKAWQNLINIKYYEDWCRYYDAYGSYLNGVSDIVAQPGEKVLKQAKECFFKQLQAAECETRKNLRNQQFNALLKMARTLLDANTIFGQQREISTNDITRAGEYLDKIEREFLDEVARGTHVQFLLIRVKQYFRQRKFDEAVVLLKKCIAMATGIGYERDRALMVDGLNKMLALKVAQQNSKILSKEKSKHHFGSSSEEGGHMESSDSTYDSFGVFDSELGDSC